MKLLYYFRYRSLSHFVGILIYKLLSRIIITTLPFKTSIKIRAFFKLGYWVNLEHPTSFNEKILHRKLYLTDSTASIIADKFLVRDYITEKGCGEILNEMYYSTSFPENIPFEDLPKEFVIKANYGNGKNIIVKNKKNIEIESIISKCRSWIDDKDKELKYSTEIHYKSIKPRIIIEKLLKNSNDSELLDYKFFCFNGKPEFINVHQRKNGIIVAGMYNSKWEQAPFSNYNRRFKMDIPKPKKLREMLNFASILSRDFSFIRVDLYCINDQKIIFGELTYNPGGGTCRFWPNQYDKILGNLLS